MNPSWDNLDDRLRLVNLLIMDSESLVRLANFSAQMVSFRRAGHAGADQFGQHCGVYLRAYRMEEQRMNTVPLCLFLLSSLAMMWTGLVMRSSARQA
jgi:hypothetical protein